VVAVSFNIFKEGHDVLLAFLKYRRAAASEWRETPMRLVDNDRWAGAFTLDANARFVYTVAALPDAFRSWLADLDKRTGAGQDVRSELLEGAALVRAAARRAHGADADTLERYAVRLEQGEDQAATATAAREPKLARLMDAWLDRAEATWCERQFEVVADRERARFAAWYEFFPRSARGDGRHATFKDAESQLERAAAMGFDVVYLPPIHPIGTTDRKGRNNAPQAEPGDPGSPWAIGAEEGGHAAVHPDLGNLEDFRRLLHKAKEYGMEVALDIAFQCSPDHAYVKEHPEWFRWRPDGTVQYAENPPKRYEDIYPIHFETDAWRELWSELKGIITFWLEQGVRIFRVDNPHTKPFVFWEWLIAEVKNAYPEVIFLAEAFTRPKVMYHLAKVGFTQSYTYFAWRNTKWEITQYFTELSQSDVREYFRPNLWPNTPDILTEYLQMGGRAAFMARLVLAATLGATYGVYGPAFELCENRPREWGSEEYQDSEKYQIRPWEVTRRDSLKDFIARVNRIRRENPALQHDGNLNFHEVNDEQLLCFSKHNDDGTNMVLVVVNLDPHHTHRGRLNLDLEVLGLDDTSPYQVHDLLGDARYLWSGPRNYVELDPAVVPAHIFRVRRKVRTERDFDYFM